MKKKYNKRDGGWVLKYTEHLRSTCSALDREFEAIDIRVGVARGIYLGAIRKRETLAPKVSRQKQWRGTRQSSTGNR